MPIVTSTYRYKRPPQKKRPHPPLAQATVTAAPPKQRAGPILRRRQQAAEQEPAPKQPAIVAPKRAGKGEEITPEEHKRRGDAADAMFQEMKRKDRRRRGTRAARY